MAIVSVSQNPSLMTDSIQHERENLATIWKRRHARATRHNCRSNKHSPARFPYTRSYVAPTMSERPPLSRLDDSEESRARANTADGVPEHLRDHLHVPDKEVFSLKAQLKALQTVLEGAETQRDEALRVAASATARCDSFEERAAGRLEKARTRAETAERRADASERRADLGEKTSAMLEQRVEEAEAKLDETRRVAEDLRRRLDEQVATNASLEDEVTVFRARVRDLERGVPTRAWATQTTAEDAALAARACDRDRVDPDEVGIRANAARWLRELEAVGAPPTLDTASGVVSRATARTHLTPPGLGLDLAPPAAPRLGAAGYTRARAVRAASSVVERDILPAVEKMFSTRLPLHFEVRALLEQDVEPFVEWGIERRTLGADVDGKNAAGSKSANSDEAAADRERGDGWFAGEGASSARSYDEYGSSQYSGEGLDVPLSRRSSLDCTPRSRRRDDGETYGWAGDDPDWTVDKEDVEDMY